MCLFQFFCFLHQAFLSVSYQEIFFLQCQKVIPGADIGIFRFIFLRLTAFQVASPKAIKDERPICLKIHGIRFYNMQLKCQTCYVPHDK